MVEAKFTLACDEVKKFIELCKDPEKLEIYGLFKQASFGDNKT